MPSTVYKICPIALWREAEKDGVFTGAPVDLKDGFIHFSTAGQVRETAARHFEGQTNLVLVALDAEKLGPALKYERSLGGDLFPHLYGSFEMGGVGCVEPLPLGPEGAHDFPSLQ